MADPPDAERDTADEELLTDEDLLSIQESVSSLQSFGSALIAGVATFLVIGVTVTEVAAARVDFSVAVGLPAGLLAAVAVAGIVNAVGSQNRPGWPQRLAGAIVAFSAAYLIVLVGLGFVAETEFATRVGIGAVVGVIFAAAMAVRS